jgi:uncharacterized protein
LNIFDLGILYFDKEEGYLFDKYFEDYLQTGGIPEYVLYSDVQYLKDLVDDIIQKDVATVHGIKNIHLLKDLFLLLMERVGKVVSINKIAHILGISPDTAKRYLTMYSDTFLIHLVSRFGKTNEKILSPKKIYASDIGIKNYFTGWRDKGSSFENYVFLKIKDRNPLYIYENGIEIDFLTSDKRIIEVKYNREMNEKQKSLINSFPAKEKLIIGNVSDVLKL